MLRFLKYLFQLIISPGNGWEDISYESRDSKLIASEGLYPLLGITSLSVFIQYFYQDSDLISLLQQAIVTFIQFFISYFIAIFLYSVFLPNYVDGEPNEKRSTTFITYNIAILAVITILNNCIPIELSIIQFLPLFVIAVIWKGTKYMAIRKKKLVSFMFLSVCAIIMPPYLLEFIFSYILPS